MDLAARTCMHCGVVDTAQEPVGRVGGARVAPGRGSASAAGPRSSSASRLWPKQDAPTASTPSAPPASSIASRVRARTRFRIGFAGVVAAGRARPCSSAVSSNRQARTEDVPTSRARTRVTGRTLTAVAVLIASNLRKEFSGDPLFDGVSFKVERRDRVALAGPNGAGKTTLLRALVGETNLQGGDIVIPEGHARRIARPAATARAAADAS